jgi:hypothetical protein
MKQIVEIFDFVQTLAFMTYTQLFSTHNQPKTFPDASSVLIYIYM